MTEILLFFGVLLLVVFFAAYDSASHLRDRTYEHITQEISRDHFKRR